MTFWGFAWAQNYQRRRQEAPLHLNNIALSVAMSGWCLGLVLGPFERINCIMQVRGGGRFADMVRDIYNIDGVRSLA